jgi:hypothetical protein
VKKHWENPLQAFGQRYRRKFELSPLAARLRTPALAGPALGAQLPDGGDSLFCVTTDPCCHSWWHGSAGITTEKEVAAATAESKRRKNLPLGAVKVFFRTFKINPNS